MTLWGGRFTQKMDPAAWDLNLSLPVDRRLAPQDVEGSLVWAAALHQAGILSVDEYGQISAGLKRIQDEFTGQTFSYHPEDEDIHSAVERRLTELIGPVAGRLHTGRSRNDQVATGFVFGCCRLSQTSRRRSPAYKVCWSPVRKLPGKR
jgi:argininosuccinate lyase